MLSVMPVLACAGVAFAAPLDPFLQTVFTSPPPVPAPASLPHILDIVNTISPLHHLSAISPWNNHVRTPTAPPPTCSVKSAAVLIRHSAILGNDDEFEQFMQPFLEKIKGLPGASFPPGGDGPAHPWAFLEDHVSPIVEDKLEDLSERGKKDALSFGQWARHHYDALFPPSLPKKGKGKKIAKLPKTPYKVWTASSPRDIESAKQYILGAFPKNQTGGGGEGDGDTVQLIEVPNKAKDWKTSLTPHKACSAFEKESSLKPAGEWLALYGARVRARLVEIIPEIAKELVDGDILAMQMLCGYETIAQGSSPFCRVFTDEEWLDVEYYFDVRFAHMLGYQQPLSPYLGIPWVQTAAHLLAGEVADDEGHDESAGALEKRKKHHKSPKEKPLPTPKLPPNATHSQFLHPFFTHRESPGFVAVALNLFNSSSLGPDLPPASVSPPLDHRPPMNRQWRSSHVIQFLAHVALERLECEDGGVFVRAMVNGKFEPMGGCDGGVGGTCEWGAFEKWLEGRVEMYGKFDEVCDKKE